jgi:hypothetical protein
MRRPGIVTGDDSVPELSEPPGSGTIVIATARGGREPTAKLDGSRIHEDGLGRTGAVTPTLGRRTVLKRCRT